VGWALTLEPTERNENRFGLQPPAALRVLICELAWRGYLFIRNCVKRHFKFYAFPLRRSSFLTVGQQDKVCRANSLAYIRSANGGCKSRNH